MLSFLLHSLPVATAMAILAIIIQRVHFLMALLALEASILTLILTTALIYPSEAYSMFILLTFGASEAALGLACLVFLTRSTGNDMFAMVHISQC
nr:NADH dehydrogenase subunit 4L [Hesionides sp. PA-2020]